MPRKATPVDIESLNVAQRNIAELVRVSELSVNAWAEKFGVVQTSINRIVTGKQDPTAGYLHELAAAISRKGLPIEAWQLMAPNLGRGLAMIGVQDGKPVAIPIETRVNTSAHGVGVRRQSHLLGAPTPPAAKKKTLR